MNISLTEPEIKQAIREYLNKRLVDEVSDTAIDFTVGRPQTISAVVDIIFGSAPVVIDDAPDAAKDPGPIKKVEKTPVVVVSKSEAKRTVTPAAVIVPQTEVKAEPDAKEILEEVKGDLGLTTATEVDAFGAPITEVVTGVDKTAEEAPIVEGENVMTEKFELATEAPKVAAPIVDDVEDLFNC